MPDNPNEPGQRRGRWVGPGTPGGPGAPRPKFNPWIALPLILLALFLFTGVLNSSTSEDVPFSEFRTAVTEGRIPADSTLKISDSAISGTLKKPDGSTVRFSTTLTNVTIDQAFLSFLDDNGIHYRFISPSILTGILVQVLPIVLLMVILYYFVFRKVGAGASAALNLGRNKVKVYDRKEMKSTFADVAGVDEAKEELREIVDFLKTPKKYQRLGGRIPKGVLLLGPPGCGKTLLARAVAGEANVPFFFMSGSEFVEMFVGLGAARVRELFQQAKEKAPALVFLDEIDTIGKGRAGVSGAGFGSHDEREQTLNQLLVEMDGFDASKGVIIMAATNRPDVLDQALVRPGRFDRQVVVDRPDLRGREEILRVHARGVALDPQVELRTIASRTPGFTGADLANVVNEAALLAARREKNSVTMEELEEAIDRATAGLERKSRVMSEKEKRRVAVHEMGHALVGLTVENADPVHRVTIIPRGTAALGITMTRPTEDRYMLTEDELRDRLAMLLGGRTAEEVVLGDISTGAQNDLENATSIARAMVAEFGMSDQVGPLSFGREDPAMFWAVPKMSAKTAELIDEETADLVNEAHERAQAILTAKRALLEELAELLIAVEVIDGDELLAYAEGKKPIPDPATAAANGQIRQPVSTVAAAASATTPVVPSAPPMPQITD